MAADKQILERRKSILFFAIAHFASKSANRELLDAGSSTAVSAEINGTVGRASVTANLRGSLNVGHPSTVSASTAAPIERILASVLAEIPEARRVTLLNSLNKSFHKSGAIDVDEALVAEAKTWLKAMKLSTTQSRAGSVSFVLTP